MWLKTSCICGLEFFGWLTILTAKARGTTSFTILDFYVHSWKEAEKTILKGSILPTASVALIHRTQSLPPAARGTSLPSRWCWGCRLLLQRTHSPTPAMPNPCVCVQLPEKSLRPRSKASDQPRMWPLLWAVAPCCFNSFIEEGNFTAPNVCPDEGQLLHSAASATFHSALTVFSVASNARIICFLMLQLVVGLL